MEDNINQEDPAVLPTDDIIIGEQINVLLNFENIDFSALYDEWQEDKVRVITTAMKIINARQKQILKDMK